MSRITQRTSVVSVIMTGKSIHEMIWEEDGKPQNLFSSTWSLATSLAQGDLATSLATHFAKIPTQPLLKIEHHTAVELQLRV